VPPTSTTTSIAVPLAVPLAVPVPHPSVDVAVLVRRTYGLLAAGVPLTLLLDLAEEDGPRSRQRYAEESAELGWLRP
jgi:hypothetical protein